MTPKEARELSISLKLPDLIGTALEIQQAEIIRAEKLQQVPFFEAEWEMFMTEIENKDYYDNSLQLLKQSNVAEFWIKYRELDFWQLLKLFQ
ncbi:hypothetical protein QUA71_18425 [Microcoleus sp. MON1_C5]|uniref:hypothetical protein n=1 Tax=Microcoleus sp. MON1_C5 TaxID=2818828 RepID=UPI002FCFFE25